MMLCDLPFPYQPLLASYHSHLTLSPLCCAELLSSLITKAPSWPCHVLSFIPEMFSLHHSTLPTSMLLDYISFPPGNANLPSAPWLNLLSLLFANLTPSTPLHQLPRLYLYNYLGNFVWHVFPTTVNLHQLAYFLIHVRSQKSLLNEWTNDTASLLFSLLNPTF